MHWVWESMPPPTRTVNDALRTLLGQMGFMAGGVEEYGIDVFSEGWGGRVWN